MQCLDAPNYTLSAGIRGSFLISAFSTVDGKREYIGTEAVPSRWHVEGCMNCQNHLEATATFRLPISVHRQYTSMDATGSGGIEVEVRTRHGLLGGRPQRVGASDAAVAVVKPPFRIEIR